uniref:Uncharacterized protein n=1 Tax=Oryza brachyantha TaxID=4533 RepID=J3KXZ9_ORYBR
MQQISPCLFLTTFGVISISSILYMYASQRQFLYPRGSLVSDAHHSARGRRPWRSSHSATTARPPTPAASAPSSPSSSSPSSSSSPASPPPWPPVGRSLGCSTRAFSWAGLDMSRFLRMTTSRS